MMLHKKIKSISYTSFNIRYTSISQRNIHIFQCPSTIYTMSLDCVWLWDHENIYLITTAAMNVILSHEDSFSIVWNECKQHEVVIIVWNYLFLYMNIFSRENGLSWIDPGQCLTKRGFITFEFESEITLDANVYQLPITPLDTIQTWELQIKREVCFCGLNVSKNKSCNCSTGWSSCWCWLSLRG